MSEELKPCPFCGGVANLIDDHGSDGEMLWQVWHECSGFDGMARHYGNALRPWFETPWYPNKDYAIAAWNRRAYI